MASQTKSAGNGAACGNVAQPGNAKDPRAGSVPASQSDRIGIALGVSTLVNAQTMFASIGHMAEQIVMQVDSEAHPVVEAIIACVEKGERHLPEALQAMMAIGEALCQADDNSVALLQERLDDASEAAPAPAAEDFAAPTTDGERFEAALSGRAHAHASHLAWQQWALAVSVREGDGAVGSEERNRHAWLASMSAAKARELAEAIDLLPHPDRCSAHDAASTLAWQLDALCMTVRDMGGDIEDSDRERRSTRGWLAAMAAEKSHELARAVDALPVQITSGADAETVLEAAHA